MKNNVSILSGLLVSLVCSLAGCGSDSGTISTAPSAPVGVIATACDGEIVVNWTPVANATSYIVYGADRPGVTKSTANTTIANFPTPMVVDNRLGLGLPNNLPRYYVVTASNAYGESVPSNEVSATPAIGLPPPSAPTGVTATAGSGEVYIKWNSVIGADSYNIYYATSTGVSKTTGTKIVGRAWPLIINPQVVSSLTNGMPYYFVVTALNTNGESSESSEVSAIPVSK